MIRDMMVQCVEKRLAVSPVEWLSNAEFIWLAAREIVARRLGRPPAIHGHT